MAVYSLVFIPQGLKPDYILPFSTRLKPCPCYKASLARFLNEL